MKVSKITISRLYPTEPFAHVRYELTVEVKDGESAATAVIGMERILSAMNPKNKGPSSDYIDILRAKLNLYETKAKEMDDSQFRSCFNHSKEEAIKGIQETIERSEIERQKAASRYAKARQMFDDLGGAAEWKDAKLSWDNNNEDDQF